MFLPIFFIQIELVLPEKSLTNKCNKPNQPTNTRVHDTSLGGGQLIAIHVIFVISNYLDNPRCLLTITMGQTITEISNERK